jgi:hypothetical protein
MKFKYALIAATCAVLSSSSFANNYGMAGCGLGSIVSKEMGWGDDIMQVLAATTNGTAYSQTFGITFGTSNCGDAAVDAAKKAKKKTAQQVYLQYNLAQVKADAAKGEGEFIEGLAGLFGCQNTLTGSYAEFARLSQVRHADIFASDSSEVVWQNYMNAMQQNRLNCPNS